MPPFNDDIHALYDDRINTLGKIKARSLGADAVTLTALDALVYAQIEGGVKDLTARTIVAINARQYPIGLLCAEILAWRNPREIENLRSAVTFKNFANTSPIPYELVRIVQVRQIDVQSEFNQMNAAALNKIYAGFRLEKASIKPFLEPVMTLRGVYGRCGRA